MEKVPVVAVKAKANRKDVEVEAKSETGEGNGNKSGDAEVVGDWDDSGKKQSLAEVGGVSKMATKTEKRVKKLYKSNDADDDEEAVKGCMSWLL